MASAVVLTLMVLCSCYSVAHGGDENGFVIVPTSSFEPDETAVCSNYSNARVNLEQNHSSSVWLPLAHRHGPCAPRKSSASSRPSLAETLRRNRARSSYIMSRARAPWEDDDEKKVVIPTHLGSFVNSLMYVVTVGLGTPAVQQTLLIDTGGDLSWVQCKPWCSSSSGGECSSQKDPLFDPSRSSTYSPVRCGSALCRRVTVDEDSDRVGF